MEMIPVEASLIPLNRDTAIPNFMRERDQFQSTGINFFLHHRSSFGEEKE
jgi:hypothetical protein